jgi:hypothetical protein
MEYRMRVGIRILSEDEGMLKPFIDEGSDDIQTIAKGQSLTKNGSLIVEKNVCLIQDDVWSIDMDSSIRNAISKYEKYKKLIDSVREHSEIQMYCSYRSETDQLGFFIDANLLAEIVERHMSLAFSATIT